jgi:ribose/xylose/arabinose/galactoside ABC-type transport system permease subunit
MNRNLRNQVNSLLFTNKAIFIVIVLVVAMSLLSPVFLTSRNILNVLRQVCVNTMLACGFVLILGCGCIDLSVGSTVGFTGVCMAKMMVSGVPVPLAIVLGLTIGACIGTVNNTILTLWKLPPFIVTLGMMSILRGSTYIVSKQQPVINLPESFVWIGQGYIGAIPFPIFIMLAVVVTTWIIANRTKFGRYLLAIGGNFEASRVSGINVIAVRYGVFITMGICSTIASIVMCGRAASAQPSGGLNMEMDALAAGVIGGTSMSGGTANIIGAFFGALIVGIVNNSLNLMGVDSSWQVIAKGSLILIAVILDCMSTVMLSKLNTGT